MRALLGAMSVLATLAVSAGAVGAGETVSITLPPDLRTLKPGPGVEVVQRSCTVCHSADYIIMQPAGGAAQWQGVVAKMRSAFGANISDADARTIVEYLSTAYGPPR